MTPMTEDERIARAVTAGLVRWLREIREQERRRMLAAAEGTEDEEWSRAALMSPGAMAEGSGYVNVKEFAALQGWSEWQVRERVRSHGLPHIRMGKRILIPANALALIPDSHRPPSRDTDR